jgi:hypothetical protein
MARGPNQVYTAAFKHNVLLNYKPNTRGSGFKALADRFEISGGGHLVALWHKKWDGTVKSLCSEPRPGRTPHLSKVLKKRHIDDFVAKANQTGELVNYRSVQDNVFRKTKVRLSRTRIKTIGRKEFKIGYSLAKRSLIGAGIPFHFHFLLQHFVLKLIKSLLSIDYAVYKSAVEKFRRKLQRISKKKLIFIDQSSIEIGARPHRGLHVQGKQPKSAMHRSSVYPKRIDIMGAISYNKVLSVETNTPAQRRQERRKGYRKIDILNFIQTKVSRDLVRLGEDDVVFILDKGCNLTVDEVKAAFKKGRCNLVKDVLLIPTSAGKHVSPLDNCLWHQLKEGVRAKCPIDEEATIAAIKSSWKEVSKDNLNNYYRHCALMRRQDVSKDLPE